MFAISAVAANHIHSAAGTITVAAPTSKPVQFTMALIPGYLSANKNLLSVEEVNALEAALADYQKVRHEI